jgi:hypothetical protein
VTFTISKTKLAIAMMALIMVIPATAMATHAFTDVPDDKFYAAPVEWAFDNGITTGRTPTSFAPDDNVTRGESVTFLKRYQDNVVGPAVKVLQEQADYLQLALVSFETYTNSLDRVFARAGSVKTEFTVACDDGDRATGGGFSNVDPTVQVLASYQDPTKPDTWTVEFFNPSPGAADEVNVYVTCLRTLRELN